MGNETEPAYKAGESWLEFLARRGIPSEKAEPIHEIQWLRCERIRWMAEAERHQMTERERAVVAEAADTVEAYDYFFGDSRSAAGQPLRDYLARTASPAES